MLIQLQFISKIKEYKKFFTPKYVYLIQKAGRLGKEEIEMRETKINRKWSEQGMKYNENY